MFEQIILHQSDTFALILPHREHLMSDNSRFYVLGWDFRLSFSKKAAETSAFLNSCARCMFAYEENTIQLTPLFRSPGYLGHPYTQFQWSMRFPRPCCCDVYGPGKKPESVE